MNTFRNILLGVSAALMFALTGCGGFSCDAEGKCSADPKREQADIDSCQKQIDGECGAEFEAVFQCFLDNQVCGDDDKTDSTATFAKCTKEQGEAVACCLSKPTAEGCS